MYAEIGNPADYRAALYIRLSKEDEQAGDTALCRSESQSITNQRSLLREFADSRRLCIYDEYIDDGWSGGNFDRPAFARMIGDIEAKNVNMVITKDMSRLGRDYIQTGHYMERYFPEKRVRYIALLDGIDTGTDSAMNDITPFKAIMNDMYAKDISRKIKSVKHDKQRKGQFIGGKAPYGYTLAAGGGFVVDETAAEVVRTIFRMAAAGESARGIAAILNEQQIPPPAVYAGLPIARKAAYSGRWSAEGVSRILQNRMYAGDMVQGTTRKVNYKSKKCVKQPKAQWVVVSGTHPPLAEEAVFDAVQRLMGCRRQTRTRTYDHLLKGLVFCKECGHPLGVINRGGKGGAPVLYFVCRSYQRVEKARECTCHCIKAETVATAVMAQVKRVCERHMDRDVLCAMAEAAIAEGGGANDGQSAIQRLRTQITAATANMDTLYMDRLNGVLDEADFARYYAKLQGGRADMQARLDAMQEEGKAPADADALIEGFMASIDTNRELLSRLVEKVELAEDRTLYIHFRFGEAEAM